VNHREHWGPTSPSEGRVHPFAGLIVQANNSLNTLRIELEVLRESPVRPPCGGRGTLFFASSGSRTGLGGAAAATHVFEHYQGGPVAGEVTALEGVHRRTRTSLWRPQPLRTLISRRPTSHHLEPPSPPRSPHRPTLKASAASQPIPRVDHLVAHLGQQRSIYDPGNPARLSNIRARSAGEAFAVNVSNRARAGNSAVRNLLCRSATATLSAL
jgi:hypothetical protein